MTDPTYITRLFERAFNNLDREQRAPVVPILARRLSITDDQADTLAAKLQRPNLPFLAKHLPAEALRTLLDTPDETGEDRT